MKRIITAVSILLLGLIGTSVSAQPGYQVKGVVVDAMGPVIGATVMEKGTSNGTATGLDGDYVLTVSSPDAVVEISCIGYATQTFAAREVPKTVTLAEDTEFLDDVVVIGYGTVKKDDLTGSVTALKPDTKNKGLVVNPQDMLAGKVAGVSITNDGIAFGGTVNCFISTSETSLGSKIYSKPLSLESSASKDISLSYTPASAATYYLTLTADDDGKNIIGARIKRRLSKDDFPEKRRLRRKHFDARRVPRRGLAAFPRPGRPCPHRR